MADREALVRVVVLGRSVRRLAFRPGATLRDVLDDAAIDTAGRDLHVNGRPADLNAVIGDGDLVTVIPRVRGG
jgi:molybdopterin converting factor small subunit